MSDDDYPSNAGECSDYAEWNYILDFFDFISYQLILHINQMPAKMCGYTMRESFFLNNYTLDTTTTTTNLIEN